MFSRRKGFSWPPLLAPSAKLHYSEIEMYKNYHLHENYSIHEKHRLHKLWINWLYMLDCKKMFALFKISISDILNPYIIQKFKEQATLLTQAVKHDFALLERWHTATKTYFLEVLFREALLEFRFLLCRRSAQGTVAAFLGDRILGSIRLNPSDSIRALVFPLFQNFLACSSYQGERSRCPTHFWLVLTSVWEPWYIILNQFYLSSLSSFKSHLIIDYIILYIL